MKNTYLAIAIVAALLSLTQSASAQRAEFVAFDCHGRADGWTVYEFDQAHLLTRYTVHDCEGNETTYTVKENHQLDSVHIGTVLPADSIRFIEAGGGWSIYGYKGGLPTYAVESKLAGVTIIYGSNNPVLHPYDLSGFTLINGNKQLPAIDSTSFTTAGNAWEVSGYANGKKLYVVSESQSGMRISILDNDQSASGLTPKAVNGDVLSNMQAYLADGTVTVAFKLSSALPTSVRVYDEAGHLLGTYDAGILTIGETTIQLPNISPLPSGMYFVHVKAGDIEQTQKFVVTK